MRTRHSNHEATEPPAKKVCSPRKEAENALISPQCVISIASEFPEEMMLGPPEVAPPEVEAPVKSNPPVGEISPRPQARHAHGRKESGEDEALPHMCWWKQLRSLNGTKLMQRLKEMQVDEMIDYHGGVLNARFVELIVELYDHVASQGDTPNNGVYDEHSPYDPETDLPYWCPKVDEEGFGRMERLRMAAEYDVWQWYLVTGENYSLLDALVWMGVHMRKLFSRPPSREDDMTC
eukprot:CAMPEP_0181322994 /NCGR_PEP_ID=MMETSP1101-20121128/19534_1 /TAXON_ID=46948 /ORGANISM="Rhodomonas abbreviata, Strain Caron Lab Isolate" /LENGTH=234 /DNA_ID=CAMNT_0023430963 /DNA_START=130 /DNA_END=834 /DNA_ORIENTATION=+